jgi:hypothetical protein
MTEISTLYKTPLRVVSEPTAPRRVKCDRDVKLHLPEALYDDLARQARADNRAVSEYIRVLLERHLYGTWGAGRG